MFPQKTAKQIKQSQTRRETLERRKGQVCKVYELKICRQRLSKTTHAALIRMLVEAKWLRNAILAADDVFNLEPKIKQVEVKCEDPFEIRPLRQLGSQIKPCIERRIFFQRIPYLQVSLVAETGSLTL